MDVFWLMHASNKFSVEILIFFCFFPSKSIKIEKIMAENKISLQNNKKATRETKPSNSDMFFTKFTSFRVGMS